ncbi:MAG: helix-turn-helix transcriptional regulator [Gemmatimonadetes bacterium]|nr:helix-turn-helix transcriptional regulator [Gemmatimonadota bacterium]
MDAHEFLPLPNLTYLVLLALAEGDAHGWEIIRRIRPLTEGQPDPSSGSLYLAMVRMEERGLLAESKAPRHVDARRRYYRLTPLGKRVLAAESARLESLVEQARRLDVLRGATGGRTGR